MTTQGATYGLSFRLDKIANCDKELQRILSQVHHYLYNFGHSRLFLAIGKSYFQKCCRSWVQVTTHLEKFLQDPKSNYSLFMSVLEREKQKFPENSFFYKKLKEIELLISMGPSFSFESFFVIP
ncbi:MAG: hypothetical protein BGO43_14485 [Gammaproteobacteria bacterium 39-13]|nr:hypothetical protein [Gammaproteobacteria bacterium]OJV88501.1 MAG: hypothetical protein BGO43_14485 [Gammaproteobacteria bacterium 39-13]